MQLVVFGDSHAVALGRGLVSLKERGQLNFPGEIVVQKIFGAPQINKKFFSADADRISIVGEPTRTLFSQILNRDYLSRDDKDIVFGCTMGFTTTKFFRHEMWSNYSVLPKYTEAKAFVSEAVVAAMFLRYTQLVVDFYSNMQRLGLRCFAIVAPPPQSEDPAVVGGISPEELLLIDKICRKALSTELAKAGIECVSPPPSVYTDAESTGFLRPEYSHERESDFHHGNQLFGELMLETIIEAVRRRYGSNINGSQAAKI